MQKLTIVIPVYRNQGSLWPTYDKIMSVLRTELASFTYEVIFVNDGSDDNSLGQLKEISAADSNVGLISFSRNFGQLAAINAGYAHASGDAIINISADLQDPPELIAEMVQKWQAGNEIVICHRIDREDSTFMNVTSRLFYSFTKILNPKMPPGGFDYALLDRKALDAYKRIDERNAFWQGDLLWLGFNVSFIPYKRLKREIGKSQWTIAKKLKYLIDGLLSTSYFLIRAMSAAGMMVFVLGVLYSLVIIYGRLIHKTPFNGYAPIMISILIIGGLIMLMLGIIGEYLWRIYDEVRGRDTYIINEKVNLDQ